MNNKVLSMISLATKAGKTVSGEFSVEKAVKERKVHLVIVAADSSDRTKKTYRDMCNYYKVPLYFFGSKSDLGHYTGKEFRASVAILDEGFKNTLIKHLDNINSEI
jgi:ribosomal protein L7Ae-like RNA K-turn-binding protein